jgi:hypothetical protein
MKFADVSDFLNPFFLQMIQESGQAMVVCLDRILGEAFFNNEVMEKLIQTLFHLHPLIPPYLRRRWGGYGESATAPLPLSTGSLPAGRQFQPKAGQIGTGEKKEKAGNK